MSLFSSRSLAAIAGAIVCASCALQATPQGAAKGMSFPGFPNSLSMDIWQARTLANDTPLDKGSCDYTDSKGKHQCRVDVFMSFSGDICTAEVKGFLTVPSKKVPTIVWTLVQPVGVPQDFSFPERYGIIIVSDQDEQIDSKKKPGTGGVGDGDTSGIANQFYWHNKNSKPAHAKIADIYYLPAVQWKKKQSDGTTSLMLCRAIDPRIVNEGD